MFDTTILTGIGGNQGYTCVKSTKDRHLNDGYLIHTQVDVDYDGFTRDFINGSDERVVDTDSQEQQVVE